MDCRLLFVHRGRVYDHLWDWDFKKSINSFNRYLFSIHCVWGTLLDTIFLEFMGQWSKQIFLQRNAHTNIHLILKPLGKEPWRRWRTQSCCWNHVCAMHFPHLVIYTTAAAGCRLEIAAIATRRGCIFSRTFTVLSVTFWILNYRVIHPWFIVRDDYIHLWGNIFQRNF